MRDFSKSPGNRRNLVRQIKGPGMNLGLKKRHKLAQPKSITAGLGGTSHADPVMKQGPMYSTLFQPAPKQDYNKRGGNRARTRHSTKVKTKGFF